MAQQVILLVDDNRTHLYALGKHLTESGFKVLHAGTGASALELAVEELPDVILLDINLPDTLGYDICRQLKANERTKSIPVVFHSATHDTAFARSQAEDVGAASFLSYPINVEHLESVLRGAIAQAQRDRR